jgi:hypothetical protein
MDFDRFLLSSSASRSEAAMAAFNSGSSSSLPLDEDVNLFCEFALPLCDEDDDLSPDTGPIDGSKKPPPSGVVTSRMKIAITRPGFSRTKSM